MDATPSLSQSPIGVPSGAWRWAALAAFLVALAAAGLALATPLLAGWAGYVILAGIAALAGLFLFAIWPRATRGMEGARRIAEAAGKANVAWAITGEGGAVIDCNSVYRRMAGVSEQETPPPPELALAGEPSAAVLYRLTRDAGEGKSREESFQVMPGLEIIAAVRPLDGGQAAWWFVPRLAARGDMPASPPVPVPAPQPVAGAPVPQVSAPAPAMTAEAPQDLFRDAPMGVAFADADGVIVDANKAFAAFFGGAPLKGRKLAELVDAGDRATVSARIAKAAAGSVESNAVELRTASEKMGELFASPVPGGKAVLYLVDVTDQKALETKFAQSQKMQAVGQLAGGVAHDFNNLLTVIIGNCEFLLMRHPAGDPSFKELNEVHQNALRAATLVGQLLAFSRKQTMQPKVLGLNDVVGELAQMLRRLLREGIELKVEKDESLWPVHADEAQLSNALINLVVNARDAMPSGGAVSIRLSNEKVATSSSLGSAIMPPGDYVRLEVADTGIGMSKEIQSKIFDPFFTTKPVGQGTGLGLATVYGIVKQSGGFIDVRSEVGKGTSFFIYLPRHAGEGAQAVAESAAPARDVTGQDTILLVEDEEAVRSFAARALTMRGYTVLEAGGGDEALEIVQSGAEIHLIITDVVMPNMDGPTMVKHVKQLKPEIPVIFMSGYAEEAFRRDEGAGDIHFLPKPFGLKQLAAKVKDVLSGTAVPRKVG
jgi:two-component system cell cycle sensor histidine kinase/response regulator CckA